MGDKIYRVMFVAKPIAVHAPNEKRAIDVAIEYLRQAGTGRIIVEDCGVDLRDNQRTDV